MSVRIEFRYAVLTALAMLLWLIVEYVAGLQDTYIAFYPYASMLIFIVPVVTYRLALIEELDRRYGKLSFTQAFLCCFIMTVFVSVLNIPVLMAFYKLINPDFFQSMIEYTAKNSHHTMESAAYYFNLNTYITESVLVYFLIGTIISLALAYRMKTIK